MSNVKFRDGNKVEMDLHFGCSTWLYDDHLKIPAMQEMMDFILDLYDDNEEKWELHRSFYISMNAMVELDFSEKAKRFDIPAIDWFNDMVKTWTKGDSLIPDVKLSKHIPMIFGRVVDFQPNIHELKVYKGKEEQMSEAESLNKAINDARNAEFWENPMLKPFIEIFYGHSIPFAAFPNVERCLGMKQKDSQMTISEGMAIMSFDYNVQKSTSKCLFKMKEDKLKEAERKIKQEAKRLEFYNKTPIGWADRKLKKLSKKIDEQVI